MLPGVTADSNTCLKDRARACPCGRASRGSELTQWLEAERAELGDVRHEPVHERPFLQYAGATVGLDGPDGVAALSVVVAQAHVVGSEPSGVLGKAVSQVVRSGLGIRRGVSPCCWL